MRRPSGACQRMAGSSLDYKNRLFAREMHDQSIAHHLQHLYQYQQQHHGDDHHVSLETLVAETDRQVTQTTGATTPAIAV